MADITIKVLDPAEGFPAEDMSFLSVDEATRLLDLHPEDAANDEQLKMQIAISSAVIMRACNRMFARQRVAESWRDLGSRRLFLTHWPVKEDDIETVSAGGRWLTDDQYELEEISGKLSNFAGWVEPAVVTYTGGFNLPDEAPLPLKHATLLLVRQARLEGSREAIEGIRMIAHKESRVMFFDPSATNKTTANIGPLGTGVLAVDQLLYHYMRFWV
jgi:hypothetical protein